MAAKTRKPHQLERLNAAFHLKAARKTCAANPAARDLETGL